jgi:hypothetical protein
MPELPALKKWRVQTTKTVALASFLCNLTKPIFSMKNLFLFLLLAAINTTGVQAQVKQSRQLAGFQMVQAGGGIDVFLTQGNTTSVVVEADNDLQGHVTTEVKGGTLVIGWESGFSWKNLLSSKRKASVYVTCPRLEGLTVSGGSDARGQSTFQADKFAVTASGGSDVTLTLNAKTLTSNASGGSDLRLAGRVERQVVTVSGGSDYHAFGLQSTTAEVTANGGSDASVSVDGELKSTATGGSDLRYKGNARLVSSHSSGGGSVRRAN